MILPGAVWLGISQQTLRSAGHPREGSATPRPHPVQPPPPGRSAPATAGDLVDYGLPDFRGTAAVACRFAALSATLRVGQPLAGHA
jgi:hypothetical protein